MIGERASIGMIARARVRGLRRRRPSSPRADAGSPEADRPRSPGWRLLLLVVAPLYAICAALATYPAVTSAWDSVPGILGDQLQHLWVMRWYAECLAEGRSPLFHPGVDFPVGAPLGNFSPMHLQSLLYLALSPVLGNDFVVYRVLWLIGFSMTGTGTFVLASRISGDRWCAGFAGLVAMLSTPMIVRSWGHLELMYVGGVPLFLASWIAFVDRPGRGRLAASAGLYLLMTMCAAYFAVLSIVPAVLYSGWAWWRSPRGERRRWLADRLGWLVGFALAVLPALLLLFLPQVWAQAHGYSIPRTRSEFDRFGASLIGYVRPEPFHRLSRVLPIDLQGLPTSATGPTAGGSYLGVATLALLLYSAVRRLRFPGASYWWAGLGVLVVLSMGPYRQFGDVRVELPSGWLWRAVPGFGMIRDTSRFNLIVPVFAGVIASSGLGHLVSGIGSAWGRRLVVFGFMAVALVDLSSSVVPVPVPDPPACYAILTRDRADASFLEIDPPPPETLPGPSAPGYWQSLHGGRTSSTFSGVVNAAYLNRITLSSPVSPSRVDSPDYLLDPDSGCFDFISRSAFRDSLWLFSRVHGYDYLILHRPRDPSNAEPGSRRRLRAELAGTLVLDDEETTAFDLSRLDPPGRPTLLLDEGWRIAFNGQLCRIAERRATIAVANPDPDRTLVLSLRAQGFRRVRTVRLMDGPRELARLRFDPDAMSGQFSAPFTLPGGIRMLTLESDGEKAPRSPEERPTEWDGEPFSLYVEHIAIVPPGGEAGAGQDD